MITGGKIIQHTSTLLKCFCLLHQVHVHLYEFTQTRGESMLPTLAPQNDFVHVLKHRKLVHTVGLPRGLQIGDCVVLMKPHDSSQRVCKRITGLPGDLIQVDPSYDNDFENCFIRVPRGHVWVTGDNLSYSLDSRSYSVVPLGLVVGKVVAANDFNKPLYDNGNFFGYRRIINNYINV
ncbi:similar to Saccharomyces cerevisiae YMR150C IMP1 Catalytic subunit of the mitochondrial inner membrane peptidase complex [Maudiozyma barnettii]|uniref:Similar to Saccharomyces cerevisiae YMR150C IMP1 Catalytic subunit of the mitochondrial inner membrane peptidase complex n=1 Tax=Maudiozyma barnettii TaxID=61262 RepID=A0A8H2ZGD3_9SACH|nr:endopeptidase catalytic subunit IMP1 [Kazachstania barnettii]CAB4254484.1 similar to Saccharomyces cerevisiae YMR150C IMP1 Catalytic subunit of the mitochondrial inner membrane peptidase complex [Kazachstania barnettii]CAD1782479.1 similar to Saccharomyces cerevisiae YMR150C IMP1 Catalytic subunit of the mitochondrial inner membrane peptidase complex [Kazachstania barnettii]